MMLSLFLVLLFLSIMSLVLGYFTDADYLTIVGFFFLFSLSTILMTGNLEYQTGAVQNTTFTYTGDQVSTVSSTTALTYEAWDNTTALMFGRFLAIVTGFAFGLSLYFYGRQWRRNRENF